MSNDLLLFDSRRQPIVAPREYVGNMCGIRVPDLPLIPGCTDASLVMTWLLPFYVRYDEANGTNCVDRIIAAYRLKYIDFLLDWAFARSYEFTPAEFVSMCVRLSNHGCRPVPMLCSKDFDPHNDVPGILANIRPLVQPMIDSGVVSRVGYGFELNAWLTVDASQNQVQDLIDAISPLLNPSGIRCYIHFLPRTFSWQQPDAAPTRTRPAAWFWNLQVGKAAGLFAQTDETADMPETRDWVNDCLERCAGNDGMPTELIDGHGVDFIGLEITASRQFAGMSEADGDAYGRYVLETPPRTGPAGIARVMGSGNGF